MPVKQIFATYDWKKAPLEDAYQVCPMCGAPLTSRQVAGKVRKTCLKCRFINFRNPPAAVSVLIARDGNVLLGKRLDDPLPEMSFTADEELIKAFGRKEIQGLAVYPGNP